MICLFFHSMCVLEEQYFVLSWLKKQEAKQAKQAKQEASSKAKQTKKTNTATRCVLDSGHMMKMMKMMEPKDTWIHPPICLSRMSDVTVPPWISALGSSLTLGLSIAPQLDHHSHGIQNNMSQLGLASSRSIVPSRRHVHVDACSLDPMHRLSLEWLVTCS